MIDFLCLYLELNFWGKKAKWQKRYLKKLSIQQKVICQLRNN